MLLSWEGGAAVLALLSAVVSGFGAFWKLPKTLPTKQYAGAANVGINATLKALHQQGRCAMASMALAGLAAVCSILGVLLKS